MAESTMTFRVDDDLKASFAEAAKAQDRTVEQPLRILMEEAVAQLQVDPGHDAWFKAEVALALAEAADPATVRVFHDDVLTARRDDIVKRARSQ